MSDIHTAQAARPRRLRPAAASGGRAPGRRYLIARLPLARCPLPGWRASLVRAVPAAGAGAGRGRAVRLTLYERLAPGRRGEPRAA